MLPLTLLRTAQNHPMLVELKNGETYNGHLVQCDNWMNIQLREVICTSKDGDRFWRMPEVYIRGVNIKYLRIPDEVIDMVREDEAKSQNRGGRMDNRNRDGGGGMNKRPVLNRGGGHHQGGGRGGGGNRGGGNSGGGYRGKGDQGGDRNGYGGGGRGGGGGGYNRNRGK